MRALKTKLLSSAVVPLIAGVDMAVAGTGPGAAASSGLGTANPTAVPRLTQSANPTAVPRPGGPTIQLAACNPCNPCAPKGCNPCNPCAAGGCNPCNPCAAGACNPCNPCAGGGMTSNCVVPRLAAANPCAAAKGCNPCNPCAPKGCNPCNPCAAGACNPCNPCAAKGCNPCNPCAAGACNPCNPCAAKGCNPCNPCAAGACNPCNPCAAKGCNPCNPCAAGACNPCNPCAAKGCNPCNPCAAGACNPCNPCGGAAMAEIEPDEAASAYGCLIDQLLAGYAKSGNPTAAAYTSWRRYNTVPYQSATHGGRYVNNYANGTASAYGDFEDVGHLPQGSIVAKDSFAVKGNGAVAAGPLFLMEKMGAGWHPESGDWRYTLVMPDGTVIGETHGKSTANVEFCAECHATMEDTDSLWFLPEDVRNKN